MNPLFLFWEQQKWDGYRQPVVKIARVCSHTPIDNELRWVIAVERSHGWQQFRLLAYAL